ncbi:MAG: hypothetical protein NTY45_01630 [Elusimicrobia bacterium]|nr:hypothetical protein [Elusimicrobiota bacterium]
MRKVKKFKIQVYAYEVLRKARKHKLDLAGAGLAEEQAMREYASALAAALEPAVVFEYLPQEDAAAARINPDAAAPLTVGILTLGRTFEEKLSNPPDDTHKRLNRIAAQVFLQTAIGVTAGLALREAEPEGFELGEPLYISSCPEPDAPPRETTDVPLYEGELVKELCARLEAEKIGVSFDTGAFTPKYSALFALPWLTKKKKKN